MTETINLGDFQKQFIVIFVSSLLTFLSVIFLKDILFSHPFYMIAFLLLFLASGIVFGKTAMPYIRRFLDKYWIALLFSILFTIVIASITKYFILAYLLIIHIASCIFLKKLKQYHIGLELITFITVLSGVAYGPKIGAFVGASAMISDYIFSGRLSYFSIVTVPTYALIGVVAGMLSGTGIVALGVGMVLFYNLFTSVLIFGFLGGDLDKCVRFGISALIFNLIIFSSFAGTLLSIMAR